MIRNGILTHEAPLNQLLFWKPTSPILNGLLTAFVTTVLSYQAAAIVLDLCLGIKRSGKSPISDIETLLLVRSSSPVSIFYSLFPRIRSFKKSTNFRKSTVTHNPKNALRFLVVVKLLFLLAIVPLINIVTIAFNIERTTWLTFEDANFKGLAFGVSPDLSIQPFQTTLEHCKKAIFIKNEEEDVMAEFLNCVFIPGESAAVEEQTSSGWGIAVLGVSESTVAVGVQSPTHLASVLRRGQVRVRGAGFANLDDERNGVSAVYELKSGLTNQTAEMLVDYGFRMVEEICRKQEGTTDFSTTTGPYSFELSEGRAAVIKITTCNATSPDDLETGGAVQIRDMLSERLAFIDSPTFEIRLGVRPTEPYVSGNGLLLLRRRRSLVSLPVLSLLTLATIILRIFVRLVTSNDVDRGIGLILRHGLGLPCCDSMLASSNIIIKHEDEQGATRYRLDS